MKMHDLPGIKGGRRVCMWATSARQMLRLLRHRPRRVATMAGDNGSISVYQDDAGAYRCSFYRYMIPLSEEIFSNQCQVLQWWAVWYKKLN